MRRLTIFCQKQPLSGTKSRTNIWGGTKCSLWDTKLPTLVTVLLLAKVGHYHRVRLKCQQVWHLMGSFC